MRAKIAFLTILVFHAIVIGGYWIIRFLGWQALFLIGYFGIELKHPEERFGNAAMICWVELLVLMFSAVALYLCKTVITVVYKRIDRLFPRKES